MHQEISDQHQQKCVLTADPHRLRNHVGKGHRQHVPRAQRHKVMQETPRPRPPHHKQPTNQVPRRGHHPQPRRHPHSSCDVVIHFGVRQSCCRFRGVCIAKSCSAGRSSRSHAALLLGANFLWRSIFSGPLHPNSVPSALILLSPHFQLSTVDSPSSRMPEQNHIPFLHHVLPPFQPHLRLLPRRRNTPRLQQIIPSHNFRANKSLFNIAMNLSRREKLNQSHQVISRTNQAIQPRLLQSIRRQQLRCLFLIHLRQLGFQPPANCYHCRILPPLQCPQLVPLDRRVQLGR